MNSGKRIIACLALVFAFCPVTASQAIVVCPDGTTLQGVDVTYYQGTIDWNQVEASGVTFAYARVSDGLNPDAAFSNNYAGIKAAGMIRGAYQMFRPGQDPLAQAELLLSSIGTIGPGDLPPALDVEVADGQNPVNIGYAIQEWVAIIEQATGRTPIIYTGRYFWNDSVYSPDSGTNPLWIADWSVACPDTPSLWDDWAFWQYTGSGSVPGISGLVDRDVFNGPLSELQILAGISPVAIHDVQVAGLRLYPNQPNPFNPQTTIKYDVPVDGRVTLRIYDVRGALVRSLVDADLPRGSHQATWDGRDASGRGMASGSYFARLEAGGKVETVRMSLIR